MNVREFFEECGRRLRQNGRVDVIKETAIGVSAVVLCPAVTTAYIAATASLCGCPTKIVWFLAAVAAMILMSLGLLHWHRYRIGDYYLEEQDGASQFLRALWSVHGILAAVAVISNLGLPALLPQWFVFPLVLTTCFFGVVRTECLLLSQSFPRTFAVESRLLPDPPPYQPPTPPATPEMRVLRGRILEKLADVQRKVHQDPNRGPNSLTWGGLNLPKQPASLHFAAIGATGSGKSVTLTMLMNGVFRNHNFGLMKGSVRGLVYDAKRDTASMLAAMGGTDELAILNPFDARALAWDMARDVTDETTARQVAQTLIPKNERENQPFFNNAARDLVSGAIISLQHRSPHQWTLRDLLHSVANESTLRELLSASPATAHYEGQYFEATTTLQNILSDVATHMAPYRAIAAAWHRAAEAGRTFSLNDWIRYPSVLILGEDECNREALAAVNRLIFTRATELLLNQPDRCEPQTWVFLDELRDLGRLDALNRLLLKGRSKNVCVVLGFQDIEGLREVYGDKVANEIVGQCGQYAFLKLNSPTTAEWASQAIGDQEVLETIRHPSTVPPFEVDPKSQQVKTRRVVLPSQLLNIEPPQGLSKLTGYYLTASYGLYQSTLSAKEIQHIGWLHDDRVPNFVACPPDYQVLAPWDAADLRRIGLSQDLESPTLARSSSPRAADVPREFKIPVVPRPAPVEVTLQPNLNPGPQPATTNPMDIPRVRIDRKKS